MDLEGITKQNKPDTEIENTIWSHLYVESKKVEIIKLKSRLVVAKGLGVEEMGGIGQRVQIFHCKMNRFWGLM